MNLLVKREELLRRLESLQREKAIYEFVLENVGKKIIKTKMMRKFGYSIYHSDAENFERTRIRKYIREVPYKTKQKSEHRDVVYRWKRYILDVIWLPKTVTDEFSGINTILFNRSRWGYRLCYRDSVPFWLLSDYGGPYTGREFIIEIINRIKLTEAELISIDKQKMHSRPRI